MRFIKINSNNKIVCVREGKSIVEGEMQSEIGLIGQIYNSDGTFSNDENFKKETVKFKRINELRQLIDDKQRLDKSCTDEQLELGTLLRL